MKNIKDTIMAQYANSPKILGLIQSINDAIDPQYFIDDFYEYVYRLSTAKGFGLTIWADKVGVSRLAPRLDGGGDFFGFNPAYEPFNTFPFSSTSGKQMSFELPDSLLRQLIIIKAYRNIIYATAPNINKFLKVIFGEDRRSYYLITGPMVAEYVFEFQMTAFERYMIYGLKMLPEPCGVGVKYTEKDYTNILGFNGSGLSNFNNGVFNNG